MEEAVVLHGGELHLNLPSFYLKILSSYGGVLKYEVEDSCPNKRQ
jgi:hypothetical protein